MIAFSRCRSTSHVAHSTLFFVNSCHDISRKLNWKAEIPEHGATDDLRWETVTVTDPAT
jgi:hypothetical protein